MGKAKTDKEKELAARLAGWTPEMGTMPTNHGLPEAPLAESENLDDLIDPTTGKLK